MSFSNAYLGDYTMSILIGEQYLIYVKTDKLNRQGKCLLNHWRWVVIDN